jgi:hypothetical protein
MIVVRGPETGAASIAAAGLKTGLLLVRRGALEAVADRNMPGSAMGSLPPIGISPAIARTADASADR